MVWGNYELPLVMIKAIGTKVLGVSWGNLWPFPNELVKLLQLPLECNWILHCSTVAIDLIQSVTELWKVVSLKANNRCNSIVRNDNNATKMQLKRETRRKWSNILNSTIGKLFHRKGNYFKNEWPLPSPLHGSSLPAISFDYTIESMLLRGVDQ